MTLGFRFKPFMCGLWLTVGLSSQAFALPGFVAVSPVDRHAQSIEDMGFFAMPELDPTPVKKTKPVHHQAPAVQAVAKPAPLPLPVVNVSLPLPLPLPEPQSNSDAQTEATYADPTVCPKCAASLRTKTAKVDLSKIDGLPELASLPLPTARPDYKPRHHRVAAQTESDSAPMSRSAAGYANRVSQAAFAAAAKCRDFATFKKRRLGLNPNKVYNSCKFFGKNNAYRSKGLCSQGVREALSEAGIRLTPGAANSQKPKLKKAGMIKVKYDPMHVPFGTVLVCGGGHGHNYGHIEIVSKDAGGRLFCSDFCSRRPTCNDGWHRSPEAYKFPGS